MQTIGEKLEEARKRRGVAIREASEFTKIRGEYLAGFENNSFDINLPEIYVRGFLRTYGEFLKLNPEKLITDYNAYRLGESKIVRRESKELLGRMDLPEEESEGEGESAPAYPAAGPTPASIPRREPGTDEDGDDYGSLGRSPYPKVAAALGAVVFAGLLVFLLFVVLRSNPTEAQAAESDAAVANGAGGQELVLIAQEDIPRVIVKELADGRELYRGPLAQGESRTIAFNERVRISYTDAEHLVIEQDGNRYQLAGQGPGQSNFP